jgi:hypothetical protein
MAVAAMAVAAMAVDTRARTSNRSRAEVERNAKVPLRRRKRTAWDVADEALRRR